MVTRQILERLAMVEVLVEGIRDPRSDTARDEAEENRGDVDAFAWNTIAR
ncbi:hypothetical protein ACWEOO_26315 [Kribbella sp. NPDC004138]